MNKLFGLGGLYEDAKAFHSLRSKRARGVDQAKRAETIIDPSDEDGLVEWLKSPNKMDVIGIDAAGATQATGLQVKKSKPVDSSQKADMLEVREEFIQTIKVRNLIFEPEPSGYVPFVLADIKPGDSYLIRVESAKQWVVATVSKVGRKYITLHTRKYGTQQREAHQLYPKDYFLNRRLGELALFIESLAAKNQGKVHPAIVTMNLKGPYNAFKEGLHHARILYGNNISLLSHDLTLRYGDPKGALPKFIIELGFEIQEEKPKQAEEEAKVFPLFEQIKMGDIYLTKVRHDGGNYLVPAVVTKIGKQVVSVITKKKGVQIISPTDLYLSDYRLQERIEQFKDLLSAVSNYTGKKKLSPSDVLEEIEGRGEVKIHEARLSYFNNEELLYHDISLHTGKKHEDVTEALRSYLDELNYLAPEEQQKAVEPTPKEVPPEQTPSKDLPEAGSEMTYSHNLETGKIELTFEYEAYKELDAGIKSELKRYYRWNRKKKKWISKSAGKTTLQFTPIKIAEKAGLTKAQDTGERLSFAEKKEKYAEADQRRREYLLEPGVNVIDAGRGFSDQTNRSYNFARVFMKERDLNDTLRAYMKEAREDIEKVMGKPIDEASDYLVDAYNKYRQAVIDYYNKEASINTYAPNPYGVGPSKYPTHRLSKAFNRRQSAWEKFQEAEARFNKRLEKVRKAMKDDKPSVGFAQRRILDTQKEQRAVQRELDKLEKKYDPENERHVKWRDDLAFRLKDAKEKEAWWNNIIQEAQKEGVEVLATSSLDIGDHPQEKYKDATHAKYNGRWHLIYKLNKETVTIDDWAYEGHRFKLPYNNIQEFKTIEAIFRDKRKRAISIGHYFLSIGTKAGDRDWIYHYVNYNFETKLFELKATHVRDLNISGESFFSIEAAAEQEGGKAYKDFDPVMKVERDWIESRRKNFIRIANSNRIQRFGGGVDREVGASPDTIKRLTGGRATKLRSLSGLLGLGAISEIEQEGYQECGDGRWSDADGSGACAWHGGFKHRAAKYRKAIGPTCFAVLMPITKIHTDETRFQNRDHAYSEDSVARIIQGFNIDKFDPIKVWKDPTSGLIYVLSGHSRLAAMKRMKKPDIPVRFFQGSEEEAIFFARLEANRLGTEETLKETLKIYIELRDNQGYDKTRLKEAFSNAKYALPSLEAYSHLSQSGKFLEILGTSAQKNFPLIENKAKWTGDLRRFHPSLRDAHENEIFDYLFTHPQGSKLRKDDFLAFIDPIINRLDFDPDKPLNLEKSNQRGVYARSDTREEMKRLKALEKEIQENAQLIRAARTQEEKAERRALQQRLLQEKEQLERNINLITKTQASLFELGLLLN